MFYVKYYYRDDNTVLQPIEAVSFQDSIQIVVDHRGHWPMIIALRASMFVLVLDYAHRPHCTDQFLPLYVLPYHIDSPKYHIRYR